MNHTTKILGELQDEIRTEQKWVKPAQKSDNETIDVTAIFKSLPIACQLSETL